MSSTLPADVGTVVVGGGIVGLCVAWFLAEEGRDVAVLDDGRMSGTTTNAGSLHVQLQSRLFRHFPEIIPALERAMPLYPLAIRHWQRLAQRLGEDIELSVTGGLMVAETPEQFAFLATKCKREQELGLEVEMLDRTELDRVAPYLGPVVHGAELCLDEGKINPLLANDAILARAQHSGAVIVERCLVSGIERSGSAYRVYTTDGSVRAGTVVIAAGAGSGRLAADFGIKIPVTAEPLHMNVTEATAPIVRHLVQHADRLITLKQLASGQIVIGGGWPAREHGLERPPSVLAESLIGNVARASRIVPELASVSLIRTWAGINPYVDGRPVLGPAPGHQGLFFALGGDAGYTLGPLVARLAADAVLGRDGEVGIGDYSVERFA